MDNQNQKIKEYFIDLKRELDKPEGTGNPADPLLLLLFTQSMPECASLENAYSAIAQNYRKKTGETRPRDFFRDSIKTILRQKIWRKRLDALESNLGSQTFMFDCTWIFYELYILYYSLEIELNK